jgi:hypothetical protein
MKLLPLSLALAILALAAGAPARAADGAEYITAVSSTAYKGYVRARRPDGKFVPEAYSFGKGGKMDGDFDDPTIDKLGFMDVARVIAGPLAHMGYLPAKDPNTTKLVIMVYWGTTKVPDPIDTSAAYMEYQNVRSEIQSNPLSPGVKLNPNSMSPSNDAPSGSDSQMAELGLALTMIKEEDQRRAKMDFGNAEMLGYNSYDLLDGLVGTDRGDWLSHTPLGRVQHDEVLDIEAPRYFVVLMAYDFQAMWKQKKHVLLWETRFSIDERHNDFTKALPAMASYASRYFGDNSGGLVRKPLREGTVQVGAPTLVELLSDPKK